MLNALRSFEAARSPGDVVKATATFLEEDLSESPVPLEELGVLHVGSVADIDTCIDRLQEAIQSSPLIGHDEDRVDRLLSFLLVAAVRARQLS